MALETDHVYQMHEIRVRKQQFADCFADAAVKKIQEIQQDIKSVVSACERIIAKRFVLMKNKDVWYDHNVAGLYPRLEKMEMPYFYTSAWGTLLVDHTSGNTHWNFENKAINTDKDGNFHSFSVDGLDFVVPTPSEIGTSFVKDNGNPYLSGDSIKNNKGNATNCYLASDYLYNSSNLRYHRTTGSSTYGDYLDVMLIPIFRLKNQDSSAMKLLETIYAWMKYELIPEGLSKKEERKYCFIMEGKTALDDYWDWDSNPQEVVFAAEQFQADVKSGKFKKTVFGYNFDLATTIDAVSSGKEKYVGSPEAFKQQLLMCDKERINLPPYSEKRLTDINLGHWELFEMLEDKDKETAPVTLPEGEPWAARPPHLDVHFDGICAIDFGTKSSVVACMRNDTRLLRIGADDFKKEVTMKDYENPTCIELRDLKGFVESYHSREGRPFTKWEQLAVSHQAAKTLLNSDIDSSVYYSVFSELKQWANEQDRRLMLKDSMTGTITELKPYLQLAEGDFDPIEVYAYYLGLAINNMYNGIYLTYVLSFPVNYSKEVRTKLLESFRRGLRKSLPPALLADEAFIKENFTVYAGASEPAAYAMAALREFDLEPKETGQTTAYGVFDFGGGTTDFDFGIERIPENRRKFKFEIEQFGQGGDVHLGGENILNVLAYEVYKANLAEMRKKDIAIALPPNCTKMAGAEGLVLEANEASQMAYMNRKILAEKLRPIWERTGIIESVKGRTPPLALYSSSTSEKNGKVNVDINIDQPALEQKIRELIAGGVDSFFTAWREAFVKQQSLPVHIFLAGNSCLSPVVHELFTEKIAALEKEFAEATKSEDKTYFVLHMPLGVSAVDHKEDVEKEKKTVSADKDKTKKSVPGKKEAEDTRVDLDIDRRITGKTGVAFGLLRSRLGGKDVKVINHNIDTTGEANFPFFLGTIELEDCFEIRIPKTVGYGIWAPFCYADEPFFELYYTTKPKAVEGTLMRNEVAMLKCRIKDEELSDDDNVKVFLRKVNPDTIEYAVGKEEEFKTGNGFKGKNIYTKVLKEK